MSRCPSPSASRSSRPSASPGPRPAAWLTWSTRSPGRCPRSRARPTASSTSSCPATAPCRFRRERPRPTTVRVPDPHALAGAVDVSIVDVAANGYRLRLVDHPAAFDRDGFYGAARRRRLRRQRVAVRAAGPGRLETLRADAPGRAAGRPAPHPRLARRARSRCSATAVRRRPGHRPGGDRPDLHNLAYHGWTPRDLAWRPGPAPATAWAPGRGRGRPPARRASSRRSSSNTVSPGYARESLGAGVRGSGSTRRCGRRATATSASSTGSTRRSGTRPPTRTCGAVLRRRPRRARPPAGPICWPRLGFDPTDDAPVLGIIGRLDPQKGFDLLAEAAPRLLDAGARLVVLGTGDPARRRLPRRWPPSGPDRVALSSASTASMARRIYAGADFFLMPSRFEPCGQGQMIAHALRHAAGRAADGRPRRLGRRRADPPRRGDRIRVRPGDGGGAGDGRRGRDRGPRSRRPGVGRPRCARAWRPTSTGRPGSAPRYAAMYERAVAIRRRR